MNLLTRLHERAARRRLEDDFALLMAFQPGEKLHGLEIGRRSKLRPGRMYPALSRAESSGRLLADWDPGPYPRRRHYFLSEDGVRDRVPRLLP